MPLQHRYNYLPHRLPDGRLVVDELCQCGKLRSEHKALVIALDARIITRPGEGPLGYCPQFRWTANVYANEPTDPKTSKEPEPCRNGPTSRPKKKPPTRTASSAPPRKARSSRSPRPPTS